MNNRFLVCKFFAAVILFCSLGETLMSASSVQSELEKMYNYHCSNYSDIYEHVPVLCQLAQECSSVVEIGIRSMVSTWGILQGLSKNTGLYRKYIGIDLAYPPFNIFNKAKQLAIGVGIEFSFIKDNDMNIDLGEADMLFIDSLHTYCHLTYELEKFSPKIGKYIAMHDTSEPWGNKDDDQYRGDYSEYPLHFNKLKRGLWPAVVDFLENHPEWVLLERRLNNHGLTILKRVSQQ